MEVAYVHISIITKYYLHFTNTCNMNDQVPLFTEEFVAHKANVNCLAMGHKSNQVLATGGDDKKVNLWAIGRQSCLMVCITNICCRFSIYISIIHKFLCSPFKALEIK